MQWLEQFENVVANQEIGWEEESMLLQQQHVMRCSMVQKRVSLYVECFVVAVVQGWGWCKFGVWLSLSVKGTNRVVSVFTSELVCAHFLVGTLHMLARQPGNADGGRMYYVMAREQALAGFL